MGDVMAIKEVSWLHRAVAGSALAALALYVLMVSGILGWESAAVEHWLYLGVFGTAAAVCLTRASRVGRERAAWALFGAAIVFDIGAWVVYWAFVQHLDPIPYPSAADGLWLFSYAVKYGALVLIMRARMRRFSTSLWIDGLISALSLAAVSAAVIFPAVIDATGGSTGAVLVNLAYPLADLLMLSLVATIFALCGWRPDRSFHLLGVGLLLTVCADSVYLYRTAMGTYEPGTLLDAAWPAAMLLFAWAALVPARKLERGEPDSWRVFLMPGAFTALAFCVLVYGNLAHVPLAATVLAAVALTVGAVRSAIRFTEMRRLGRRHQAAVGASLTDSLTGLRNHRAFHEDLTEAVQESYLHGEALTLVMLDLVGLKQTNDTLGHQAGDQRLQSFATKLAGLIRRGDDAYRIGGDEFAVILKRTGAWAGFNFAERAQVQMSGGYAKTAPALSAGIAELAPGHRKDALVRQADMALIEAKRSARKAVVFSPALEREPGPGEVQEHRLHTKTLATSLARAVDAKDSYTRSHCETVAEGCVLIAERLGLEPERVADMRLAGLLHDVGKIGIPDSILQKPGRLTEDEFKVMKTHSTLGRDIVSAAGLERQADWILHHHERVDGNGYPAGLAGDEIPLESRIILVADAFEAMTSDRPYRLGRPVPDAVEELRANAGTQFDPDCVAALEEALGSSAAADTIGASATTEGESDEDEGRGAGGVRPAAVGAGGGALRAPRR
jgi:diguanylate cyclase (GGDEF)-like protein